MSRSSNHRQIVDRFWKDYWADNVGVWGHKTAPQPLSDKLSQKWHIGKSVPHRLTFDYGQNPGWYVNMFVEGPGRALERDLLVKARKGYEIDSTQFNPSRRPIEWYW